MVVEQKSLRATKKAQEQASRIIELNDQVGPVLLP